MHRTLLLTLIFASVAYAQKADLAKPESVNPGINEKYLDPDLNPEEWVERFESESREVFDARKEIAEAVGVKAGDRIADIGAGTGLYTEIFADAVGDDGAVYAVDIAPKFLQLIEARTGHAGRTNVTPVLCSEDDTRLPPESCDVAFTCDAYHHFEYPGRTLASILEGLKPGGRFVVVDFERIEGVSSDWTMSHVRAGKDVVRKEIEQTGFRFVEEPEVDGLEDNYLMVFERPAD